MNRSELDHVLRQRSGAGLPWVVLRQIIKTRRNGEQRGIGGPAGIACDAPAMLLLCVLVALLMRCGRYAVRPTSLERLSLAYLQKVSTFELARDELRPKIPAASGAQWLQNPQQGKGYQGGNPNHNTQRNQGKQNGPGNNGNPGNQKGGVGKQNNQKGQQNGGGGAKGPCREFAKGHCQYGKKCRFSHAKQ